MSLCEVNSTSAVTAAETIEQHSERAWLLSLPNGSYGGARARVARWCVLVRQRSDVLHTRSQKKNEKTIKNPESYG